MLEADLRDVGDDAGEHAGEGDRRDRQCRRPCRRSRSTAPIEPRCTTSGRRRRAAACRASRRSQRLDDARARSPRARRCPASSTTAPLRSADLRDLALLARLLALLGCCLLGLVAAGHGAHRRPCSASGGPGRTSTAAARRRASRRRTAASTPMSSRPTMTLAGMPTAKTLSCGTTRETTPNAASVRISARMTGAATWIAPSEDRRRTPAIAPPTSVPMRRRLGRADDLVGPGEALDDPARRRRSR